MGVGLQHDVNMRRIARSTVEVQSAGRENQFTGGDLMIQNWAEEQAWSLRISFVFSFSF
jgi:hypothetical protein